MDNFIVEASEYGSPLQVGYPSANNDHIRKHLAGVADGGLQGIPCTDQP
jgi:hypothetical protein